MEPRNFITFKDQLTIGLIFIYLLYKHTQYLKFFTQNIMRKENMIKLNFFLAWREERVYKT